MYGRSSLIVLHGGTGAGKTHSARHVALELNARREAGVRVPRTARVIIVVRSEGPGRISFPLTLDGHVHREDFSLLFEELLRRGPGVVVAESLELSRERDRALRFEREHERVRVVHVFLDVSRDERQRNVDERRCRATSGRRTDLKSGEIRDGYDVAAAREWFERRGCETVLISTRRSHRCAALLRVLTALESSVRPRPMENCAQVEERGLLNMRSRACLWREFPNKGL